jgi:hypothetical protein
MNQLFRLFDGVGLVPIDDGFPDLNGLSALVEIECEDADGGKCSWDM